MPSQRIPFRRWRGGASTKSQRWGRDYWVSRNCIENLEIDLPPPRLDSTAPGFSFEAAGLRAEGRFGGAAFLLGLAGSDDQLGKTRQCVSAVLLLGAVLLGLDDQYAVTGDATVTQRQQPLLVKFGQRRGGNVEAQVHGAGHLVDILPACALRADVCQFDVGIWQMHVIRDGQHGMAFVIAFHYHSLRRWPTEQKTFDLNHSGRDALLRHCRFVQHCSQLGYLDWGVSLQPQSAE